MTADTTKKILQILQKQEKEEGNLPLLLEFYRSLLETQLKARKSTGTLEPTISTEAIESRLASGQPLVKFEELALDWPLLRKAFVEVIAVFARYPQLFGELPAHLTKPGAGRLLTKKAVKAWFTGKTLPPSLLQGADENLIQTIIQATLQPSLAGHAEALTGSIKKDSWHKNYCPICGGIADIAYLEREVGERRLLCSRCDAEWQFHRMECPYCCTVDQEALSFLADEKSLYRLYLCEKCKCYMKVIDLRKTEDEVLMPLERIYTLDLDKQARDLGYHASQAEAKKKE